MTIVVAYGDTPPGHAALRAAAHEAVLRSEDIAVVPATADPDPTTESLRSVLDGAALGLAGELDGAGLSLEVRHSELHDPADAVIQVAQELEASLICVGLRRRSPVGKLLLGSTAQRLLLDATCPVLAVKP